LIASNICHIASEMRKSISSPFTFFFKAVCPSLWIAIGLYAFLAVLLDPNTKDRFVILLLLVVWTGVPTLINYWNNFRLKKAYLSDEFLYVSNYITEVKLSLTNIENVQANAYPWMGWWRWPSYRVIITLRQSTKFGKRIMIIPGFLLRRRCQRNKKRHRVSQKNAFDDC
jgi:hypothetical protein